MITSVLLSILPHIMMILLLETHSDLVFPWVMVDLMLLSWLFRTVASDASLAV